MKFSSAIPLKDYVDLFDKAAQQIESRQEVFDDVTPTDEDVRPAYHPVVTGQSVSRWGQKCWFVATACYERWKNLHMGCVRSGGRREDWWAGSVEGGRRRGSEKWKCYKEISTIDILSSIYFWLMCVID